MGEPFTLVQRAPALEADQITRAGWPWRYQVLVDEGPDGNSKRSTSNVLAARSLANNAPQYWSGWALLADVAFASLLIGLTFWLWCWRGERIAVSETPERTRRKFDIAVASACFLLPAGLVFASNYRIVKVAWWLSIHLRSTSLFEKANPGTTASVLFAASHFGALFTDRKHTELAYRNQDLAIGPDHGWSTRNTYARSTSQCHRTDQPDFERISRIKRDLRRHSSLQTVDVSQLGPVQSDISDGGPHQ